MPHPLLSDELEKMNAYWRAANYLCVGQIYLCDNPLLKRALQPEDIKPRLLGHWGTMPGLNFLYVHLNRMIKKNDLNMIFVTGPGHGGSALIANTYLEGTYSELYPNVLQNEEGIKKIFQQFCFPRGTRSHVSPATPGSINEGGELGYCLAHAYGAVFDNPDLIAACVIGDGEAETGSLAASWHSNKFLNPVRDGAVLPILHLNGYKIAEPTILARISREELNQLFCGYGYHPYFVEGDEPEQVHQLLAETLDRVIAEIKQIQDVARREGFHKRPMWPMIIFCTPKGWTGPKIVDGKAMEGSFRSHQIPVSSPSTNHKHLEILEAWMKSYKPEELFDARGKLNPEIAKLSPQGDRRMGANPHANGGLLLRDLKMPELRHDPGRRIAEATRVLGKFLRDVMKLNLQEQNFRVFSPDEITSNRLNALFEITDRISTAEILTSDEHISAYGRVMEVLSEHLCEGWLEGYLLTGRHGVFPCYEAFVHIIDSMFNQYAKWLRVCRKIPWRRPIASLNYLLTSHVWHQDHNGFTHQDPGFIDMVINKKADIVRVYFPPDANTLLVVMDQCLQSRNHINLIIAGKQPHPQWLDIEAAVKHCNAGLGIWKWASNDHNCEPDVIMACAGDVPTIETLAATEILRKFFPALKVRVVNVVDLLMLQSPNECPHGLSDQDYNHIFPENRVVVFAFHGYPSVIHRLTHKRANHSYTHVRGYKEEGTTTTPFDMLVMNELDRFHLVEDVINQTHKIASEAAYIKQFLRDKLHEHKEYIQKHGIDMPEIRNWQWGQSLS